jgi:hypothetical protein
MGYRFGRGFETNAAWPARETVRRCRAGLTQYDRGLRCRIHPRRSDQRIQRFEPSTARPQRDNAFNRFQLSPGSVRR